MIETGEMVGGPLIKVVGREVGFCFSSNKWPAEHCSIAEATEAQRNMEMMGSQEFYSLRKCM